MSNKKQSPYGSWESAITPEKIIEGGLKFNEVRIDNNDIYFQSDYNVYFKYIKNFSNGENPN